MQTASSRTSRVPRSGLWHQYCLRTIAPLLWLCAHPTAAQPDQTHDVAQEQLVLCGQLVDTQAGKVLGETTIVISGTRIANVLPGRQLRGGLAVTDLSSHTCLPGLIDSHTHLTWLLTSSDYTDKFRWNLADYILRSTGHARATLLAGFTSVRNLGDYENESVALRNAINAGLLPGPRMVTAGPPIGSTGGHADPTNGYRAELAGDPSVERGIVNGAEDAAKAVRLHYKQKDDVIKIMASGGVLDESGNRDSPQMSVAEITAVVAAARDYGFTVAAHAHGSEAIRRAVLGGADSIEHGTFMTASDMRLMKERGTWYVPTLSAGDFVSRNAKVTGYYPVQVAAKAEAVGPQMIVTLARAYKAGVKIAFGTDAGVFPHGQNANEFSLMARAGIPPMYALQTATIHAAQLLRSDSDLGSITPGKLADIIAVNGDPIDNIAVMTRVNFVMKGGLIYKENGRPSDRAVN